MKHPHHVKAYTIKAHTVKGHLVKAHWVKKKHVKAVHVKGHNVGKRYVTKKVVKVVHTPTKKQLGLGDDLNMCAFTAAGLVTGGNALEAYMDYGAPADGATIPEAIRFMGGTPQVNVLLTPGSILGLPNHAVVVHVTTDRGAWVWTWGELRFISWDYIAANGEEAWLAS